MDAEWWWLIGYFVAGFIVAVITAKMNYEVRREAGYALVVMLFWPMTLLLAALYWLGELIVFVARK